MRVTRIGRGSGPGRWRALRVSAAALAAMAYDAATGTVVLFGGYKLDYRHLAKDLADTWTWG